METTFYAFDSALRVAVADERATAVYRDGTRFVLQKPPQRKAEIVAFKSDNQWTIKAVQS